MILNEYETSELVEMVFLYYLGIPYEVNREDPARVKMIFKCDVEFVKSKLADLWDGNARVDPRKYSSDWQSVKRIMWVGQKYEKDFYKNKRVGSPKIDS